MSIRIVEIISRSEQGITRPFFCRGDDGAFYYVKGHFAGRGALAREWLAGNLCLRMGLPIPQFHLATISPQLIAMSARDDMQDLGAGIGFASRQLPFATEITFPQLQQIDPELRAKILLFDWWVANGDRTLTENGGNPNILWLPRERSAHVIDHNLAFDQETLSDFWTQHIFGADWQAWTPSFRSQMTTLMTRALDDLPVWWAATPPEWTETDPALALERLTAFLWRFSTDSTIFWEVQ